MSSQFADQRSALMPSPKEMAEFARKEFLARHVPDDSFEPGYLKKHFDNIIEELLGIEWELYQKKERRVNIQLLTELFRTEINKLVSFTPAQVEKLIKGKFDLLNEFFSSLAQSRKVRAGGSFENHVRYLFELLNYPFDKQQTVNGKPDFILPSKNIYGVNPAECILFTVKRTLRERWRQIIIEGVKTPYYFLATIDERVSKAGLSEMSANRIYLVTPYSLKISKSAYQNAGNVLSFSQFFEGYLDPAMVRWKKAGIIT